MRKIAVIPSYEPGEELIPLLHEMQAAGFELLVVDDGSGEDYKSIFEEAAGLAQVISYPVNRGKGSAMKTAFTRLQETLSEEAVIVTVDGDGQHRPADALKLVEAAEEEPNTLFLGSRKQSKASPLRSRIGNGITRFVYRVFTGVRVYDTQTGLRAFCSRQLPDLLRCRGDRYEYEMNMLMDYARAKIPMKEIPIETIYLDGNSKSHFNTLKDSFRVYKEILKYASSSFVSFLVDYLLYLLLIHVLLPGKLVLANVLARIVSASVNFTLNRRFVFTSGAKDNAWKCALRYAALAVAILVANTLLLKLLVEVLSVRPGIAKLIVEIGLSIVSWLVQHFFVYYKKDAK